MYVNLSTYCLLMMQYKMKMINLILQSRTDSNFSDKRIFDRRKFF